MRDVPARSGVRLPHDDVHENLLSLWRPVRRKDASVEAQDTSRISWLVLFRRRPALSVTVTMSSMRTPNRPGR